jgi:hypothetical protein
VWHIFGNSWDFHTISNSAKTLQAFFITQGTRVPYRENVCIFTNSRLQIFSKILDVVEEQFKNIFYVLYVFYCYGASKKGNPLTMRGDILQTILVKNAQDIFRIKSLVL